jgi:hypothetical protein
MLEFCLTFTDVVFVGLCGVMTNEANSLFTLVDKVIDGIN